MRVLLVQLSPGFSGTERHAAELAAGLAEQNTAVALAIRTKPGPPHDPAPYQAMRALIPAEVPTYLAPGRLAHPGLLAAIARFRPDILHAHGGRSARIAAQLGRLLRIPAIATLHLRHSTDFAGCSGLIALTEAERDRTTPHFPNPVAVIPNWVTPWPKPTQTRRAALRAALNIPQTAFLFGSIGRLAPVKRMAGLIDAFAQANLPDAHLLIAGEGEEHAALAAQIATLGLQSRIHLAGYRPDARDLYATFDRFVLNSSFEPYALVLLEAAEQATPIIATATDGAIAITRLTPITLVPIDDPAALAQTLRTAYQHRADPPPPPACFSRADRVTETLAFYQRIVADQRKPRTPRP